MSGLVGWPAAVDPDGVRDGPSQGKGPPSSSAHAGTGGQAGELGLFGRSLGGGDMHVGGVCVVGECLSAVQKEQEDATVPIH